MILFGTTDRYLSDENGAAIPLTGKRKGSDAARALILKAHYNKYADHSTQNINVEHRITRLARPGDAPKQITQQQEPEAFTVEDKTEDEAKPNIVIGRPAETSEELDKWAKGGEFIAHGVEFEAKDGTKAIVGGPAQPMEILDDRYAARSRL